MHMLEDAANPNTLVEVIEYLMGLAQTEPGNGITQQTFVGMLFLSACVIHCSSTKSRYYTFQHGSIAHRHDLGALLAVSVKAY
jgi:hypothetical protein